MKIELDPIVPRLYPSTRLIVEVGRE